MHFRRSLGLIALTSATCVSAATPLGVISAAGEGVVRFGLRNILRLNETSIEMILNRGERPLEPHPYAIDLTDENWYTALATGTPDNAYAPPLPDDTIWVVNVYGPDGVSKAYTEALDFVARHNSSEAGGKLPKQVKFARLSYNQETVLATRWWLWRPPVIVIATNKTRDLRFIQPTLLRPSAESFAELLSKPEIWEVLPVWKGSLAPGGKYEYLVAKLADAWSRWHKATSKIPNVVLLGFSGFIMNIFLTWLHSNDGKKKTKEAKKAVKAKVEETGAKIEEIKNDVTEASSNGVKKGGKGSSKRK
ncbi:uncharacterized protein JCM6883_005209 [Sporobolomyces salmoneus]|uniref:uncharacterized protein n=1 Tax=Sporobolomyces salmoneus TaxID=183962 RepID=UPI0031721509